MGLTIGQKALREHIVCNGAGDRASLDAFIKAHSGDIVLKITPATANVPHTDAGWSKDFKITLETAAGEKHGWFNGPVTLEIADTSEDGSASIFPAATTVYLTNGEYDVSIRGNAAAWLAAETATLTVQQATILGYTVASKAAKVTMS